MSNNKFNATLTKTVSLTESTHVDERETAHYFNPSSFPAFRNAVEKDKLQDVLIELHNERLKDLTPHVFSAERVKITHTIVFHFSPAYRPEHKPHAFIYTVDTTIDNGVETVSASTNLGETLDAAALTKNV